MRNKKFKETRQLKNSSHLIAGERLRQQQTFGRTPEHDDSQVKEELRHAALAYAAACDAQSAPHPPACWPFAPVDFEYSENPVENLIKAGAFIAAEIDRYYREFRRACNEITVSEYGITCFDSMDAYELDFEDWVRFSPEEFVKKHFDKLVYTAEEEEE